MSKNNPSRGIGLLGTTGYIIPMFWRLVSPGLDGQEGSVSFQSIVDGEKYLRHSGGYLLHENTNDNSALFRKDATFYNHMNKYFSGYDAYESVNYPNYFIHHSGFRMKISEDDGSDLFKKDASFKEVRMSCEHNTCKLIVPYVVTFLFLIYVQLNKVIGRCLSGRLIVGRRPRFGW